MRVKKWLVLGLALASVFAVIGSAVISIRIAIADHSAASLTYMWYAEDRFYNWDFENTNWPVTADQVDWPITMMFYNNAEVDKVKGLLRGVSSYPLIGGTMFAVVGDFPPVSDGTGGGELQWDGDGGIKSNAPCAFGSMGDAYHIRIYADWPDDRFYNISAGFYVLAATHIDHNELPLCPGTWHGESELAENHFAQRSRDVNLTVYEDWWSLLNFESWHQNGPHVVDNNGMQTLVHVP
jgi:hypothetical protein